MVRAGLELGRPDPLVDAEQALPVHVGPLVDAPKVPDKILGLLHARKLGNQEPPNYCTHNTTTAHQIRGVTSVPGPGSSQSTIGSWYPHCFEGPLFVAG